MLEIAYQDLESMIGQELPPSEWMLVDQERVNQFADVTGDHQWIHVDVERAQQMLGGTIIHGYLVMSLLPILTEQTMNVTGVASALNYGADKLRFISIAPVGSRLRLKQKCLDVTPKAGGKLVKLEATMEIENKSKPSMVAETLQLFFG